MKILMEIFFSIISAVVIFIGSIYYSNEGKKKRSKPNILVISSWLIFAAISVTSYILVETKEWYKWLYQLSTAIANIWIFVAVLRSKNYTALKRDVFIILGSLALLIFIGIKIGSRDTHVLMQILLSIPYIPLIIGMIQGTGKESLGPWIVLTIGIILGVIPALINYSNIWSILYPLRSLVLQSTVIVLILLCNTQKKVP